MQMNIRKLIVKISGRLITGIYNENRVHEKEEELTSYINKIFEQQEKERIVRWLVNSIRESLCLNTVLEKTVEEVGKLLGVDRCLIALFDKEKGEFNFKNEYRRNENIKSNTHKEKNFYKLPNAWHKAITRDFCPVIVNDCPEDPLCREQVIYLESNDIKSLVIVPIEERGEILGIIVVHQVGERREWEESHVEVLKDIGSQVAIAIKQAMLYAKVQEATRLKSEFLSGMSHELRTPLNAIIGFSEMLIEEDCGKLNEKQEKFVNNIKLSGEHLLRLVNDILDLSKIESGNMEVNYEIFNIYQSFQEAVSVLNSISNKKNIIIKTEAEKDLFINADLRRFKQVMYNLLSNAVKFTEEGGEVRVIACRDGQELRVEVHDTGIGIAAGDREKIFKSFRQLDSSLTRKQEGTGLGLTLSKKIIELHKGTIDFESVEGRGTRFWFSLPGVFRQKNVA